MKTTRPFTFAYIALSLHILLNGCAPKPFMERYDTDAFFLKKSDGFGAAVLNGLVADGSGHLYTTSSLQVIGGALIKTGDDLKPVWTVKLEAKGRTQRCFLLPPVLSKDGTILVGGVYHGDLWIGGSKQFDGEDHVRSFIARFDDAGKLLKVDRYTTFGNDFLLREIGEWPGHGLVAAGIRDQVNAVVIGLDGQLQIAWTATMAEPAKVYNISMSDAGGELHVCSAGQQFINLRRLDKQHEVDWAHLQHTNADLMTNEVHLVPDIISGVWIAASFRTKANESFRFGRDTLGGDITHWDAYLTQFRNGQQGYSTHVNGTGDQIITGMFEADRVHLGFALAHAEEFKIGPLHHQGQRGFSIVEFNRLNPGKVVYSTFALTSKGRDSMLNTGIFHRLDKGGRAWLGGNLFKSETQTENPSLTIGSDTLVAQGTWWNTFIVRGTKKKSPPRS